MNILPKKRWHVRTKENIARVRRDEAKAADEERKVIERAQLAEREARTTLLRQKARQHVPDVADNEYLPISSKEPEKEHVNFFKDVEDGIDDSKTANKEHDKEKKEEQEQYEKKIGYLTYLGQDTHEALGTKSWYNIKPDRVQSSTEEVNIKCKQRLDPINIMKKYTTELKSKDLPSTAMQTKSTLKYDSLVKYTEVRKSKMHERDKRKRKKTSSEDKSANSSKKRCKKRIRSSEEESEDDCDKAAKRQKLELMRMERLKRERDERQRVELLLAERNKPEQVVAPKEIVTKQKYNSQFNPELAKQNLYLS